MEPLTELLKPMLESHKPHIVVFKHRSAVHRFVCKKHMFVDLLYSWLAITTSLMSSIMQNLTWMNKELLSINK